MNTTQSVLYGLFVLFSTCFLIFSGCIKLQVEWAYNKAVGAKPAYGFAINAAILLVQAIIGACCHGRFSDYFATNTVNGFFPFIFFIATPALYAVFFAAALIEMKAKWRAIEAVWLLRQMHPEITDMKL